MGAIYLQRLSVAKQQSNTHSLWRKRLKRYNCVYKPSCLDHQMRQLSKSISQLSEVTSRKVCNPLWFLWKVKEAGLQSVLRKRLLDRRIGVSFLKKMERLTGLQTSVLDVGLYHDSLSHQRKRSPQTRRHSAKCPLDCGLGELLLLQ